MKAREQAGFWKGAAVLVTVPLLAFLAPHHVKAAESWKQSLGPAMNLMAFGAVMVPEPGEKKGLSRFCNWCPCDGCDGSDGCCDGCCDSCDCGDCCGSCDCG